MRVLFKRPWFAPGGKIYEIIRTNIHEVEDSLLDFLPADAKVLSGGPKNPNSVDPKTGEVNQQAAIDAHQKLADAANPDPVIDDAPVVQDERSVAVSDPGVAAGLLALKDQGDQINTDANTAAATAAKPTKAEKTAASADTKTS